MADDIFDFGFSAVDESELESFQKAAAEAEEATATASTYEEKLNSLYNAIVPLLTNLKKNPEKDYIYWPNRLERVEKFEDHISSIVK
jgi:hypothetical protein|tara:strand:+ start:10121 stop:10381 length:261 start_codon:yes stop_codon:yes gene_type:complete